MINTARGTIVDEDALYSEISSGRLRAAFDVFWHEPYVGKLKEFHPDRFYMSPHVASTCRDFIEGCRKGLDNLIIDLAMINVGIIGYGKMGAIRHNVIQIQEYKRYFDLRP